MAPKKDKELSAWERRKLYWKNVSKKVPGSNEAQSSSELTAQAGPSGAAGPSTKSSNAQRSSAAPKSKTAKPTAAIRPQPASVQPQQKTVSKPKTSVNQATKRQPANPTVRPTVASRTVARPPPPPPAVPSTSFAQKVGPLSKKPKLSVSEEPANKKFKAPLAPGRRATLAVPVIKTNDLTSRRRLTESMQRPHKKRYTEVTSRINTGLKRKPSLAANAASAFNFNPVLGPIPQFASETNVVPSSKPTLKRQRTIEKPLASTPANLVKAVPAAQGGESPKPTLERQGTFELPSTPAVDTPRLIRRGSYTITPKPQEKVEIKSIDTDETQSVRTTRSKRKLTDDADKVKSVPSSERKTKPSKKQKKNSDDEAVVQKSTESGSSSKHVHKSTEQEVVPTDNLAPSKTMSVTPIVNEQNNALQLSVKENKTTVQLNDKSKAFSTPKLSKKTPKSAMKKKSGTPNRKSVSAIGQENVIPGGDRVGTPRPTTGKRSKSVSFQVNLDTSRASITLPKTPRRELSLRQKLENFLDEKGYSISKHRHLRCFGMELSEAKRRTQNLSRASSTPQLSSPMLKGRNRLVKPVPTTAVLPMQNAEEKIEAILNDLKTILLMGQPAEEGAEWLKQLEEHASSIIERQASYWVVKALLAEQEGNYHQALAIFTEAVDSKVEPTEELSKALSDFMDRVTVRQGGEVDSQASPEAQNERQVFVTPSVKKSGKKSSRKASSRKGSQVKQDLGSSFLKYTVHTVHDSDVVKNLDNVLRNSSTPKVLAVLTPIRRSVRLAKPAGVSVGKKGRRSLSLSDLPEDFQPQL